jgi:uroporphyrinogen-III synthase
LPKRIIYLLSPLKKEESVALPMISFSLMVTKVMFKNIDILMFTSKQAVVSINKIDKSWKNYPSIAIGKATQKKIEELGGEVIYAPKKFYAEVLSRDIQEKFSNKKLLYLRPKEVSFDSKGYLEKQGISLKEEIIYETSCIKYLKKEKPLKHAIIIFTSPSTIRCFFKNFEWDSSYTAVLIGKATKRHLPSYCDYVVSDEPLINACVKKALKMRKNNIK